jgi:hypothetical protein
MKRPICALTLMACAPLAGAGCGGSITGTVTFQNKPVASGTVVVVGSDMLPHYGTIEDDGGYTVPSVPTGLAKIAVFSPGPDGARPAYPDLPDAEPVLPKRASARVFRGDPQKWFPLPDKYRDFDASGLGLTVTSGENRLDLDLD